MPLSSVAARPPRMTITRLDNPGTSLEAQFNPEELKEAMGAEWSRLTVPGNSHQVKQFSTTTNRRYSFTLAFLAISTGPAGIRFLKQARGFLQSVLRPRAQAGSIASAGAPRVLFVWPAFLSVTATLEKVDFTFSRFGLDGSPIEAKAAVEIEEIRDSLITADDFDPNEV